MLQGVHVGSLCTPGRAPARHTLLGMPGMRVLGGTLPPGHALLDMCTLRMHVPPGCASFGVLFRTHASGTLILTDCFNFFNAYIKKVRKILGSFLYLYYHIVNLSHYYHYIQW